MRVKLLLGEFGSGESLLHPYMAPELVDSVISGGVYSSDLPAIIVRTHNLPLEVVQRLAEDLMRSIGVEPPEGPGGGAGGAGGDVPATTAPSIAANMWSLACLTHKMLTSEDLFGAREAGDTLHPIKLDRSKLTDYCIGVITLPLSPLEESPINEAWTSFLKSHLHPHPRLRDGPKKALGSEVMKLVRATYPHRWRQRIDVPDSFQMSCGRNAVLKQRKTLGSGNMGIVSVKEEWADGRFMPDTKIAVKEIAKSIYIKNKVNYMRELLTLIEVKGVSAQLTSYIIYSTQN